MLPWKTMIVLQKDADTPLYLQLVNGIIIAIKRGILKPAFKLPGSRALAEDLSINRLTVVKAYDELHAQGWITLFASKGAFVSDDLPEVKPRSIGINENTGVQPQKTGYSFTINPFIHVPSKPDRHIIGFHDGPDVRIVPADLISRGYRSILSRKSGLLLLSYIEVEGNPPVRKAISDYLNSSRGLQTTAENIIITRGTQMALFLLSNVIIEKNDIIITGSVGFRYAEITFMHAGAKLVKVPVDEDGIDVEAVKNICRKKKVRALYVTSHHHYPTTVTLSAARRMELLQLSEQYNFIIIEDDYDYEFHYESSPILPLASADRNGMVIYIGSFSKTIAPGMRVGYLAAPQNLISELAKLRQVVDSQGDPLLEQVVAELLKDGEIRRHMKKSLKIYKERRDHLVALLQNKLQDVIQFKVPDGGLSIWAKYDKSINLPELSDKLRRKNLILSKGLIHDLSAGKKLNSTRMGFGWMNEQEAEAAVSVMADTVKEM